MKKAKQTIEAMGFCILSFKRVKPNTYKTHLEFNTEKPTLSISNLIDYIVKLKIEKNICLITHIDSLD